MTHRTKEPATLWTNKPSQKEQDEAFDAAYPGVYAAFVRAAEQVRALGREKYSAYTIRERIRWHFEIEKNDREFLFNNNWTPDLARRLMRERPEFAGFFELRERREERAA